MLYIEHYKKTGKYHQQKKTATFLEIRLVVVFIFRILILNLLALY